MRDYDDLPYIVIERHSGGMGPFVWGALVGAGVALLLAPRSGAETQDEIRRNVRRIRDTAEDRVNEARGTVTRTRDRIVDRIDAVRSTFEEQADRARDAVDTGRRAARDARSELERRVAEAKAAAATPQSPPDVDIVVTEVIVEESDERPELG